MCNLSLIVVEHPRFNNMVSSLRTGYKPPTRDVISNKCNDKNQAVVKQQLNNKTVTMQQDGQSTNQNDLVIATSHDQWSATVKASQWALRIQAPHTRLLRPLKPCLDSKTHAERTYDCNLRSIATNDIRNMQNIRAEFEKEDENLITYGCFSYIFNLKGQDLTPSSIMTLIYCKQLQVLM